MEEKSREKGETNERWALEEHSTTAEPTANTLSAALIKKAAAQLGFQACGMAPATAVEATYVQAYRAWLDAGGHADMEYLAQHANLRSDPRLLLPGAQTVVSVAMNYHPAHTAPQGTLRLADYALGRDYHDVLRARLYALAAALQLPQGSFRVCVDTAPMMERYWAVRCGLGWKGKSQLLVIPGAGTQFFLGELLMQQAVDEHDKPMASRCGRCRRCIDACPTAALAESGRAEDFKAQRCLSYQTIEHRGPLDSKVKQKLGDTFYGCDRCQHACPVNKWAQPTTEPELQPSPELLAMTADDWLHLTIEQYRRLFKGSAVKRAKYEGLMRNIRAALGKNEDENTPPQTSE